MNTNYTLRDFVAYFSTGSVFVLIFSILNLDFILNSAIPKITSYNLNLNLLVLTFIFFVPIIYIVGHLIAALDYSIFHRLASKILETMPDAYIPNWLFTDYRVSGIVRKEWKLGINFWQACLILQKQKLYDKAEYRYVLNDLFKNLIVVNLLVFIYAILLQKWILVGVSVLSFMLLRDRAIMFGMNFLYAVSGTYKEIYNHVSRNEYLINHNGLYQKNNVNYEDLYKFWKTNDIVVDKLNSSKEKATNNYLVQNPKYLIAIGETTSNKILGTALIYTNGRKASIERLCVAKEKRRQGIGQLLLKLCEEKIKSIGLTKIYCLIINDNLESRALINQNGFKELDKVKYYIKEI